MWVLLMVPVSAFAAVVAMAGPQRLAAESSMQDAADDLAVLSVAWRDGYPDPADPLLAFLSDCGRRSEAQQQELAYLTTQHTVALTANPVVQDNVDKAQAALDAFNNEFNEWERICIPMLNALARDLGYLGVEFESLRGSYSDSLKGSGLCSDTQYTNSTDCTANGGDWSGVPCKVFDELPGAPPGEMVVHDAVHVNLIAEWQNAGWAAAQVWPEGMTMGAESIARFSRRDPTWTGTNDCGDLLVAFDTEGRPVWAGQDPAPESRRLVQSVGRTVLSG